MKKVWMEWRMWLAERVMYAALKLAPSGHPDRKTMALAVVAYVSTVSKRGPTP